MTSLNSKTEPPSPSLGVNPLEEFTKEYFSKLNSINGYLYQMKNRIESHKKRLTDSYNENGIDINSLFAGSSLAFSDLSEWPQDGWRRNYVSGRFHVKGKEYLNFTEDLIQREAALSMALGYEALEAYLKNICANFILLNQRFVDSLKYTSFKEKNKCNSTSDVAYWKEYLKLSYKGKNNKYLLKFLREVSPEFGELEKNNNRLLDLSDWLEVSSMIRHAVVHSNSVIKKQELSKMSKAQKEILNKYFPGKTENNEYIIRMEYKSANKQLVRLTEYGFSVFKCLSIAGSYEWEIFGFKKDI